MSTRGKKRSRAAKRQSRAKSSTTPTSRWRHLFGGCFKWGATAFVWAFIVSLSAAAWYATDLPDINDALETTRLPTVTILAADGTRLHQSGDRFGAAVQLADLPPALPEAVLATEDRRFFDHGGIDLIGVTRAALKNLSAGRIVQGGSTITQQVAKNLFLSHERTLKRKIQELMLALWLEHTFTKDQILTLYLNRVYLGAGVYGVDAAAQTYFNRPAKDLSLYQSALIAGLLKAPSRYNPRRDQKRADARTRVVLNNMVAAGYITQTQADAAGTSRQLAGNTGQRSAPKLGTARHFVDWVRDQVPDYVSGVGRDLVVVTTLDPRLQTLAENSVAAGLKQGTGVQASEAALIAMTPEGAVRALVGGRDYRRSQFNRAVQSRRQPGSAFKPVVYLAALENGMRPNSIVMDSPVTIASWTPKNFSGKHQGPVSLQSALAASVNTVPVKLTQQLGPKTVVRTARRLGVTSPLPEDASLALGTGEVSLLELTALYGVFAHQGLGVWPHAIQEIRATDGEVFYQRRGSGAGQIIDPANAARITAMLSDALETGTGKQAQFGHPAAGKTGTSQNFRDAVFVGYSAHLVTGVWYGNDNGRPMKNVTGGGLPATTFRSFMRNAHKGLPKRALPGVLSGSSTPGVFSASTWEDVVNFIRLDGN